MRKRTKKDRESKERSIGSKCVFQRAHDVVTTYHRHRCDPMAFPHEVASSVMRRPLMQLGVILVLVRAADKKQTTYINKLETQYKINKKEEH